MRAFVFIDYWLLYLFFFLAVMLYFLMIYFDKRSMKRKRELFEEIRRLPADKKELI